MMSAQVKVDYEALEDVQLAQLLAARDANAVRLVTTRNNQRLFRTAWSILKHRAEAEDAVQSAYLKAFAAIESFEGRSSLSTWLTRIVMNEALGRQRSAKRRRAQMDGTSVTVLDDYQWNSKFRVLNLNPKGRWQTKKFRPVVPVARQVVPWLDATKGYFVAASSVRSAWDNMATEIGLPRDGESGMKLIRRSMAKLLRDRLPKADWVDVELFLGHSKFDSVSDIYAPFDPSYCAAARREIEAIIDEIEALVPGAFTGIAPDEEKGDVKGVTSKSLFEKGKNGGRGKD